jgi:hypothetical protein
MTDTKKPSRFERAEAAFMDSVRRRELPEHPASRVMEVMMGRPSVSEPDGGRRYRTLDDESEHLRLFTVYAAAKGHPLLEACTRFAVHKNFLPGLPPSVRLQADISVPPRGGGWRARNTVNFDPREIDRYREWETASQMMVKQWLRDTELQLVEQLDSE